MGAASGLTIGNIALFIFVVASQILGSSLMPRTDGFTNVGWTAACLAAYTASFFAMARIVAMGMPLSLLIPIMSAVIPLAMIAVGVLVYHEGAPPLRILLLVGATALVSVASMVK